MRALPALIRVGHFLPAPAAEQECFAAGGGVQVEDVIQVVLLHDEDEVGPAGVALGYLAGAMPGHGYAELIGEGKGCVVGGVINQCADAGRLHINGAAGGIQLMPQKIFCDGASANVAGADGEDLLEHGWAAPEKRGAPILR